MPMAPKYRAHIGIAMTIIVIASGVGVMTAGR